MYKVDGMGGTWLEEQRRSLLEQETENVRERDVYDYVLDNFANLFSVAGILTIIYKHKDALPFTIIRGGSRPPLETFPIKQKWGKPTMKGFGWGLLAFFILELAKRFLERKKTKRDKDVSEATKSSSESSPKNYANMRVTDPQTRFQETNTKKTSIENGGHWSEPKADNISENESEDDADESFVAGEEI